MTDQKETVTVTWPLSRDAKCPFDPPPELAEIRAKEPITPIELYDGKIAWLATRHADIKSLLQDSRVSADGAREGFPMPNATMAVQRSSKDRGFLRMDAPDHMRQRKILQREFTVKQAQSLEPFIEDLVDRLLDAMQQEGGPVDLYPALAHPVPAAVTCRFLDLPPSDTDFFLELVSTRAKLDPKVSGNATASILEYFGKVIAERTADRGDDLVSRWISERLETGELSEPELRSMLMFLLIGGFSTTANMIALGALTLLQHPDQLAELRQDPQLWPQAIEELLRYLAVAHWESFRLARDDIQVSGIKVKAGEGLILPLMAANRDPEVFPDPDRFDIHRDAHRHLTFGSGPHQCLGQAVARTELQIALPRLFERFPTLRLAIDFDEIVFNERDIIYGIASVPVTW